MLPVVRRGNGDRQNQIEPYSLRAREKRACRSYSRCYLHIELAVVAQQGIHFLGLFAKTVI